MTVLKGRQKAILEGAVRYFIKTGEPITSGKLFDAYDFGIKPAMIRCELNELGAEGFLEQGHPSGGRRPTHKAYRLFVNGLLEGEGQESTKETSKALAELHEAFIGGERDLFIEDISTCLGLLGVGYAPDEGHTYQSGLFGLLRQFEEDGRDELLAVVRDFEAIADRLRRDHWWEDEFPGPRVFVGESPITRSPHLSVIADRLSSARGDFLVFAIGPTRMDYERSIRFFKSMEQIF